MEDIDDRDINGVSPPPHFQPEVIQIWNQKKYEMQIGRCKNQKILLKEKKGWVKRIINNHSRFRSLISKLDLL